MIACSKCKIEKPFTEFFKRNDRKRGYTSQCKKCQKIQVRKHFIKNEEKILQKRRKWYEENKESHNKVTREYWAKNKEKLNKWQREHSRKPEVKKERAEYYKNNREKIDKTKREHYKLNKEKYREYGRKRRAEKKDEINKKWNIWDKRKRANDPLYRIRINTGDLIRKSFIREGFKKKTKTAKILGCSFEELKEHFEKQFKKGMSWDNREKWHIDHIIPVASANNEDEVIKLNHYTNLQPIWAEENIIKNDEYKEEDKKKFFEWYDKNV